MMSSTGFAGGCACGAVRLQCTEAPLDMLNCHCRDCQRAGGTAFAPTVILAADGFVVSGALRFHEVLAASGNVVRRYFCGGCGSPLFARTSGFNERVALRVACLDDSRWFNATRNVWTERAQPWNFLAPPPESVPTLLPPG